MVSLVESLSAGERKISAVVDKEKWSGKIEKDRLMVVALTKTIKARNNRYFQGTRRLLVDAIVDVKHMLEKHKEKNL